jgi:hypothetical protein
MSLRTVFVITALLSFFLVAGTGPAYCQGGAVLNVCQELVNSARSYEARATAHGRIAKALSAQIQSMSRQAKSEGTMAAIESLFQQYDDNRALENKFRTLYRQATEESERCMKSAQ